MPNVPSAVPAAPSARQAEAAREAEVQKQLSVLPSVPTEDPAEDELLTLMKSLPPVPKNMAAAPQKPAAAKEPERPKQKRMLASPM